MKPSRPIIGPRRAPQAAALLSLLCLAGIAVAVLPPQLADIAGLFGQAEYEQARHEMAEYQPPDPADPHYRLWEQRLTDGPEQAEELALMIVREASAAPQLRLQAALDGASVALARHRADIAWRLVAPLLDGFSAPLPGDFYLMAGRTLWFRGDRQRAREMLASVRIDDPAFAPARATLGRISLEMGDHELALRYFESAQRHLEEGSYPELTAGAWQALRMLGRDLEARELADQLVSEHPASLAALEIRELQRRDDVQIADPVPLDEPEQASPEEQPQDTGRFTIQLAAFLDRALGMQFVARWRSEITGLRIVRAQDALGQPLHRIQVGRFTSRVQAETELNRLQRLHGLDGFVTESDER